MFCILLWPRQELPHLTSARIMQGIGGSMFSIAFGIMRDKFEPEKLAVAQGIFSSMFSVGCSNRNGHRWCLLNLICNLFGGHNNRYRKELSFFQETGGSDFWKIPVSHNSLYSSLFAADLEDNSVRKGVIAIWAQHPRKSLSQCT
jgi:MFS family permease